VRAGLALRGYDADELARELNLSRRTLDRTLKGERQPREWETARVEELLGLPDWFIRYGIERSWTLKVDPGGNSWILVGGPLVPRLDDNNEPLLTFQQVASWLGVSVRSVKRRWADFEIGDPEGLPGFRLGPGKSAVRFHRSEVQTWLDRRRRSAEAGPT
jgi:predicted DNA-binding transcriptional regulator AlpA